MKNYGVKIGFWYVIGVYTERENEGGCEKEGEDPLTNSISLKNECLGARLAFPFSEWTESNGVGVIEVNV